MLINQNIILYKKKKLKNFFIFRQLNPNNEFCYKSHIKKFNHFKYNTN